MRALPLPAGLPRTKPRAMGIGLRYARGTLVTVYDAEDQPDPAQLKKAVWGFQRADDVAWPACRRSSATTTRARTC